MVAVISAIIGNLLLITGALFLFSAGLGVLRMPDTYFGHGLTGIKNKLGHILVLIGLAFLHPAWTLKLIILVFFVMLTNPVSSHALARAAHTIGIYEPPNTAVGKLDAVRDETGKDTAE